MEDKVYYEIDTNFAPILRTAKALLKARGADDALHIINVSSSVVLNTCFDNWNGGSYQYTLYLNAPVKEYAALSEGTRKKLETNISEALNEIIRDEQHYFCTEISPSFVAQDIDWQLIGGEPGKDALKKDLERLIAIMIDVSTGGSRIKDVDAEYKSLHQSILSRSNCLNLEYPNKFSGLWDWYTYYKSTISTYQGRRQYIRDLFSKLISALEQSTQNVSDELVVDLSDWQRVQRTLAKINKSVFNARHEEDFQSVGLLCREILISLAQMVYVKEMHGATNEKDSEISSTDSKAMLSNYISSVLAGKVNEELRSYANATHKLANALIHKRTASKRDMLLAVSATTALIQLIGIIESKIKI